MIIHHIPAKVCKPRVAAYCRVSSLYDSQEESLEVQKRYYRQYILDRQDWEAAGLYVDEGINGASIQKRRSFQNMLEDAMNGKIDVILVKSISGFSRNAVECQVSVRKLKTKGVRVIFGREKINSMNAESEFIFNIRAAFAQEESRMLSENVRWVYRKNFESGVYHMGNHRVLGYDEIDGQLTPNKDAATVRAVFELFAKGKSYREICRHLEKSGARRLRSDAPFTAAVLKRMLYNPLYSGDLHTLRSMSMCFLQGGRTSNTECEWHYWKDHHAAIVDRETWELA